MVRSRDRKTLENIQDSLEIVNTKLDEILIELERMKDVGSSRSYECLSFCEQEEEEGEPFEESYEFVLEEDMNAKLSAGDSEDGRIFLFEEYSRSTGYLSLNMSRQLLSCRCQTL